MPTYLCHGFRWHRRDVRIFVILNNLDDVAPDWLIGPTTATLILDQFTKLFSFLPKISDEEAEEAVLSAQLATKSQKLKQQQQQQHYDDVFSLPPLRVSVAQDAVLQYTWSPVKLLEEYDPEETVSPTRPYAYVADHAVRVELSVDILGEIAAYQAKNEQGSGEGGAAKNAWFSELRDKLQAGSEIGWYVIVCGDETRNYLDNDDDGGDDDKHSESDVGSKSTGVPLQQRQDKNGEKQHQYQKAAHRQEMTTMETTVSSPSRAGSVATISGIDGGGSGSIGIARSTSEERRLRTWQQQQQQHPEPDYSYIKPPPIPDDGVENSSRGQGDKQTRRARRPSLRHRLSKASGLRKLFKKDDQPQAQAQ